MNAAEQTAVLEAYKGPVKRCSHCSRLHNRAVFYPANTEFFYADVSRPDGLSVQCKKCRVTIQKKWYRKNRAVKDDCGLLSMDVDSFLLGEKPLPEGLKICSNPYCSRVRKATEEFFGNREGTRDGLTYRCRRCLLLDRKLHGRTPEQPLCLDDDDQGPTLPANPLAY